MPMLETRCGHTIDVGTTFFCAVCQKCFEHCECVQCPTCRTRYVGEEICLNCGMCGEQCCQCLPCTGCGKVLSTQQRAANACGDCGKCNDCCGCYKCRTCNESFKGRHELYCYDCKNCIEHCRHLTCNEGHKCSIKGYCPYCGKCPAHCKCEKCPACGVVDTARGMHKTRSLGVEGEVPCGKCRHCCRCNVKDVAYREGKFQMFHSVFAKGQFKRNPLRRHISMELEVNKYSVEKRSNRVNTALDKWKDPVVRDGSIATNDLAGFEINTNPCNGDLFLDHIKEICDGLSEINAGCTTACGVHVHVNVKGTPLVKDDGTPVMKDGDLVYDQRSAYTHYDLRRLIMLYNRIEPAVFGLCSPVRLESQYCLPCGKFYMTKHTTPKNFRKEQIQKMYREGERLPENTRGVAKKPTKMIRKLVSYDNHGDPVYKMVPVRATPSPVFRTVGTELARSKKHKYERVRYKALNLHSFFMRGTVEFRHKEGTVNYSELTNWALICGQIVDAASKMTEAQIRELPTDARKALLAILPTELQQYAERKWAAQDAEIPRFQQMIADRWRNQNLEVED